MLYSFANSRLLPRMNWVGLDQHERLWKTTRSLVSIRNLMIFGSLSLVLTISIGFRINGHALFAHGAN